MKKLGAFEELRARGMVEQVTNEAAVSALLDKPPVSFYIGYDPTAESLHIGSLMPIMGMAFLQRHGHRPVALVGGATGMIGDPSGRSSERELLTHDRIVHNAQGIRKQLEHFLSFDGPNAAVMVNNYDWTAPISYIDWLRDIGKHFSVNAMIAKESVRRRLEDRESGISYTEFSYQLLQAYDFCHLFDAQKCLLQAGGGDQWGNITAGIDLIRRVHRAEAYGLTFPLVTSSSGEKFGKSAGNAIWLDPTWTSPYQFYQYWIQADDHDVAKYLNFFTFLHPDEIAALCAEHEKAPHERLAQKTLAAEVTRTVHGADALAAVQRASQVLFGGEMTGLGDRELLEIFNDVPSTRMAKDRLAGGIGIVDALVETALCASKGEARRLLQGGGVYVNNQPVRESERVLGTGDLASETVLILRTGKKKYHLLRFQ